MTLVFDNAMLYNPPGHPIHMQAAALKHLVAVQCRVSVNGTLAEP